MNCNLEEFRFQLLNDEVVQVVTSILESILFHRTRGKNHYWAKGVCSQDSLGYEEVDVCFDPLDLAYTYVRVPSVSLTAQVSVKVAEFHQALRHPQNMARQGQISLEFYSKCQRMWPLENSKHAWEKWTIFVELVTPARILSDREIARGDLAAKVQENLLEIGSHVRNHDFYLPETPPAAEEDHVFDKSFENISPYLFELKFSTSPDSRRSSLSGLGGALAQIFGN